MAVVPVSTRCAAAHSRAPRTCFSPGGLPASNSRSLQGGNRLPGSGPVHSPDGSRQPASPSGSSRPFLGPSRPRSLGSQPDAGHLAASGCARIRHRSHPRGLGARVGIRRGYRSRAWEAIVVTPHESLTAFDIDDSKTKTRRRQKLMLKRLDLASSALFIVSSELEAQDSFRPSEAAPAEVVTPQQPPVHSLPTQHP